MNRSRTRKREDRRNFLLAAVLGVAVLFGVGAIGYHAATRDPGLETGTLCPAAGPTGHVVLLVDKTDPLNFTQNQAFATLLDEVATKKVAPGQLLSIFVVGEDYTESALPIFQMCNPGRGEGKSRLTATPELFQKQFHERFRKPLQRQLQEQLRSEQPAKASPIFEMMQLVSINGFRKQAVEGTRRLIVVSDMLHNTAQYSMYRDPVDFTHFQKTDYAKRMQVDLRGVEAELHYVLNKTDIQTRRHVSFWEAYFLNAGGRLVAVEPLEG